MQYTKNYLASKFMGLCQLFGIPCGIVQAIELGVDEYATLDYDRTNGGYAACMKSISRGTESGFMRFSSNEPRRSLTKMCETVDNWMSVALYAKENGFAAFDYKFNDHKWFEKSDVVCVFVRFYESGGNLYHCVMVEINGKYVGHVNDDYGSDSVALKNATELIRAKGWYMRPGDDIFRSVNAKCRFFYATVKNSKHAKF